MATQGIVKLLDIMVRARQEADMVNSNFVTDPELVSYIQGSYTDLYNMLLTAYGNDYYNAIPASFNTLGNQQFYPLPDGELTFLMDDGTPFVPEPFYKLLGVDYQLSQNNVMGYVSLRTFTFTERNKYAVPNFANFWGFTNLRYRLFKDSIWFTPVPAGGQNMRLWYAPRPTNLINTVNGTTDAQSTVITMTDTSHVEVGQTVFSSIQGLLLQGTTVVSIVDNTSITISQPAQGAFTSTPLQFFNYDTLVDGIAGFEEIVVIQTAIKMKDKEESDTAVLQARFAEKKKFIEGVAENRDAGSAGKTADVSNYGEWGNGNGGGWGDVY